FDYSINHCTNGTVNNNCRLDPKPIRWDFLDDPYRRRLHDVMAALLHLRTTQDVFETGNFQLNLGSGQAKSIYLNSPGMNAVVVANVGVTAFNTTLNFQHSGAWYEYYTGSPLNVNTTAVDLQLGPGEYRLYLDQFVPLPNGLNPTPVRETAGSLSQLEIYPNPAQDWFFLHFALRENSRVLVEIFDATGRRQETVFSGELPAGDQQIIVEGGKRTPGIYLVVLTDGLGNRLTSRLVQY
ncbi:MAG: T9SS type A sorting domain-containing protein, partial [Saprospiraceae bacterium]|nr:T9SS type A sorting domain-containing protein [Saprospiraceae bacterium]